jgi:hypothetical protein
MLHSFHIDPVVVLVGAKMREHLASVTTIMKLSDEYDDFEVKLDHVHPRFDETLALPLFNKDGDPA